MDETIKNFLEQVNRASDGRLAAYHPDPDAGIVFIGGPTPEHPESGYLVVRRPCRTVEEWCERWRGKGGGRRMERRSSHNPEINGRGAAVRL